VGTLRFTQHLDGFGHAHVKQTQGVFWLLKDRVSMRELLRRKNMDLQDFNCVLCNAAVEESMPHLFFECPFAIQCWVLIDIQASQHSDHFQSLQNFKDQLRVPFFMEIIILMCWTIWKARNDLIFRQVNPSIQLAKQNLKDEFQLLLLREDTPPE
jgi:hypothetical protein